MNQQTEAPSGAVKRLGFTLALDVDWPVFAFRDLAVTLQVPRRLDLLEWALLAAADAWDGTASVKLLGQELGLGGPTMLEDAAEELLKGGALARVEGDDDQVRITERGRETFERGQVDGHPQVRGLVLGVDALTRLPVSCPTPASAGDAPRLPLAVPEAQLVIPEPPGREAVRGLLARHQQGLPRDAEVTRVQHTGEPPKLGRTGTAIGFVLEGEWLRPLALARPGTAEAEEEAARLDFVRTRGLDAGALDGLAQRVPWVGAFPHDPTPVDPPAKEPPDAIQVVLANLGSARTEVVIHPAFAAQGPVGKALRKAAERGVRVVELGQDAPQMLAAPDLEGRGGRVRWPARLEAAPAAVVIDGKHAIVVELHRPRAEWSGHPVPVQRVNLRHERQAAFVRDRLVDALLRAAPERAGLPAAPSVSEEEPPDRPLPEALLAAALVSYLGVGDPDDLRARVVSRTRKKGRAQALEALEAALRSPR